MRLALLAALAPPYFIVTCVIATLFAPKGYRSASRTVSDLAGPDAPHPEIINAAFMGYAALVQGLGPRLHRAAGGGRRGRLLWGLVGAYGLGGLFAGAYRTGSRRKIVLSVDEHTLHGASGRVAFGAVLSLSLFAPFVLRGREWARWRVFSWLMFAATCALAVPYQAAVLRSRRGILQRGFFATTMAWVFATALTLARSLPNPSSRWGRN